MVFLIVWGNTPTPSSSAGSLAGLIRHPNVRHSDFLVPNPTFSKASGPSSSQHTSNRAQSISNSSSYANSPSKPVLLSESLSQTTPQRPVTTQNNDQYYSGHSKGLVPSINDFPQKPRPLIQGDLHSNKVIDPIFSFNRSIRFLLALTFIDKLSFW